MLPLWSFSLSLSHQGTALALLDSLPHMIWYSGLTALFLFLLARAALEYLATALFVAVRPLFSFRQAQNAQVFPLKLVPFCTLFAGLASTNKMFFISLLLLFDSRSVFATLSSPPSFLLLQTLCQKLSYFFSCSIRLQWVPGHLFLPRNDAADELVRRGALLAPSAIPCCLSLLLSLVSTLALSRTGGIVSHRKSLTHRLPRFPLRNMCSLVMLAVFPLVYPVTDKAFC